MATEETLFLHGKIVENPKGDYVVYSDEPVPGAVTISSPYDTPEACLRAEVDLYAAWRSTGIACNGLFGKNASQWISENEVPIWAIEEDSQYRIATDAEERAICEALGLPLPEWVEIEASEACVKVARELGCSRVCGNQPGDSGCIVCWLPDAV